MTGLPFDAAIAVPVTKRLPGEEGVWAFIFGDLIIFSIFFVVFLSYRADDVAQFSQSQRLLNQVLGLLNTGLLLTSSWFVALAIQAARSVENARRAPVLLLASLGCAVLFIVVKVVEWTEKIGAGHTLTSSDFFMFYFVFTGIHLLHVVIGSGVLLVIYFVARRPQLASHDLRLLEAGGIFWHLVDLLWVFLFALFYVLN
jgi:nitric oxide reductase NorE protein